MLKLPARLTRSLLLLAGTVGALTVVPVLVLGDTATVIGWT